MPSFCFRAKDGNIVTFIENGNCLNEESNNEYTSACEISGNTISFTYIIHSALKVGVSFAVICNFPQEVEKSIHIRVQGNNNFMFNQ